MRDCKIQQSSDPDSFGSEAEVQVMNPIAQLKHKNELDQLVLEHKEE